MANPIPNVSMNAMVGQTQVPTSINDALKQINTYKAALLQQNQRVSQLEQQIIMERNKPMPNVVNFIPATSKIMTPSKQNLNLTYKPHKHVTVEHFATNGDFEPFGVQTPGEISFQEEYTKLIQACNRFIATFGTKIGAVDFFLDWCNATGQENHLSERWYRTAFASVYTRIVEQQEASIKKRKLEVDITKAQQVDQN